jgi:hypothetical protein
MTKQKQIDNPIVVQDDIAFSSRPKRTLFFSVSEASERTPEFNLVVNFVDWFYRSAQASQTWENVPSETVFEHQDAEEYHVLIEIVIDRLLEMCEQDGIRSRTILGRCRGRRRKRDRLGYSIASGGSGQDDQTHLH